MALSTSLQEERTHTDRFLNWNTNHPIYAKMSVEGALIQQANSVYSSPEGLAKK